MSPSYQPNIPPDDPSTNKSPINGPITDDAVVAPSSTHDSRFRWEIAAGIIAVVGAIVVFIWWNFDGDRTMQVAYTYYAAGFTVIVLSLWWMFFSGLEIAIRLYGLIAVLIGGAVFVSLFRHEGFTGEFYPVYSFRWSRSAEEKAIDFFEAQSSTTGEPSIDHAEPLIVTDADWPQFRGPSRLGVVRNVAIRRDWSRSPPREVWRHPVGRGWSSFAVVDGLAFTQEQRGEEELVVCYDVSSGTQKWAHSDAARLTSSLGGDGPRGTPTLHDSRLYALGGTGILNCLEPRTGQVIWSRNILDDSGAEVAQFGMSTSPFIYDDKVVVNAGGTKEKPRGVIAYNRLTGDVVWAHGARAAGYTSPVMATFGDSRQLLIFGAHGLAGHDAETGEELWFYEWQNNTDNNCVDPLVLDDGTIFLSTGYGKGTVLLEVKRNDDKWAAEPIRWKTSKRMKLKISGSVMKDGFVYGLDENILSCFDPASGKAMWKGGRYGYGQLLLVDDVILISAENGDVALVEAKPDEYKEIAKFHAVNGKTWNHPVLYRGFLLVRNDEEAACFDLRPESTAH